MVTGLSSEVKDFDSAMLERLAAPAFRVVDAARYAKVSTQTVRNWQKATVEHQSLIAARDKHVSLSFFHLIELHVVSALTRLGVSLVAIRLARAYASSQLSTRFPFAEVRLKTNGQNILAELPDVEARDEFKGKMVYLERGGQLYWNELIVEQLTTIDYTSSGKAGRWHVDGMNSAVVIDPYFAFGNPSVDGIPTRLILARKSAGYSASEIAEEYGIENQSVLDALTFESSKQNSEKLAA